MESILISNRCQGQEGYDGGRQGQEGTPQHRPAGHQEVRQEINDTTYSGSRAHFTMSVADLNFIFTTYTSHFQRDSERRAAVDMWSCQHHSPSTV